MPFASWSSEYSVGVQTIDSQHSKLFDIINELHDAMKAGKGKKVTGPLLDKLLKYTKEHFSFEESLMGKAGYPDLAKHRMRHEALTSQVGDFIERHKKGEASVNVELLAFLNDWLRNHIQREDKQYTPSMNNHGFR